MHQKDKPILWIHPVTGDYKVPMIGEVQMPLRYKMLGYEVREFESYQAHQRWCRSKGLINHRAEGIPVHEDAQKSRWGY